MQVLTPSTHRQVSVVHNDIVARLLYLGAIHGVEEKLVVRVHGVLSNGIDRRVVADDGLVVLGTGEALRDGKGAARVINRRLVCDGRESFFAGVAVGKGVRAATPTDVGDIRRPNRPCKTEPVVLVHHLLFVCSNWYTDVLVVEFSCEV